MSDPKYISFLNSLADSINFYYSIIAVPIGIVLNLLTLATFLRKRIRTKSSISIFYIALSIYDIISLMNSILYVQLLPTINVKIVNFSDVWCKIGSIWRKIATQCPSWTQFIMTFDRYRSVACPQRFKFMQDPRKLITLLVSVFFLAILVNSPYLGFYIYEQPTIKSVYSASLNRTVNQI